jgi:glycosyltransferase involved in cell wall biosynthesis
MPDPFLIILPVRNGGAYVREAIASIVGQSDPDFRLVVLENASTDDTVEIMNSFNDPRIEVRPAGRPLSIEENWGRAKLVLAEVPGDTLVAFLGHDDYLYPQFVARMRELVRANRSATLFQCHFDLIDAAGQLIRPCRPISERESWQDFAAMIAWGMRDAYGTGFAFRARDYLAVGGIPPLPGILYADHLLFLRLTRLGHKQSDPMAGCAYRLHGASMSNSISTLRINERWAAFGQFLEALDAEFGDWTADDRGRTALLALLSRELFGLGGLLVHGSLNADNRRLRARLEQRLRSLGGTTDYRHWAYQASRSDRALGGLRRTFSSARARVAGLIR